MVIQPNPRIIITKGDRNEIHTIKLDPALERREGYENLILASIVGDKSRFVPLDEVLSTWRLLTPLLDHWSSDPIIPLYNAGEWAPEVAEQQLEADGFSWKK